MRYKILDEEVVESLIKFLDERVEQRNEKANIFSLRPMGDNVNTA